MRPFKSALIVAAATALLATAAQAQQKTTYSYDAQGQLITAKKIEGETTYVYDLAGNRIALAYRALYPVLQSWEAEEISWHQVGYADGDGWVASASSAAGLINYGPYTTNTPVGETTAVWKMKRDPSTLAASQQVVVLSVEDATQGDTITSRTVTLADWPVASRWEYFTVPFTLPASRKGHYLEFKTNYTPSTYVKLDRVGLDLPMLRGATAGVATTSWEAEGLYHATGFADGDGWAANVSSAASLMTYGPYVTTLAAGERAALWTMMIDNNDYDELPIVKLEVYDATQGDVITDRTLTRQAWALTLQHQTFGVPFTLDSARAGHAIEFRTHFWPHAYVRVDKIGVR
jgi:YD repeat-containing protein